jgi:hypothetical protein
MTDDEETMEMAAVSHWRRCHVGGSCDGGIVGSSLAALKKNQKSTRAGRAK